MLTVHNVSGKLNTGAALYQAGLIAGVACCACDCLHGNADCNVSAIFSSAKVQLNIQLKIKLNFRLIGDETWRLDW